ncbi:MAG TPA: hypothetical protein VD758_14550 [Gemmatimonadaceae bacterium]|nr:hypothetical protein [Gemmatimonadaceae bacterium]
MRFHLPHFAQTAQRRPFAPSKASRLPTVKCSIASFLPSDEWQKMQVEYKEVVCAVPLSNPARELSLCLSAGRRYEPRDNHPALRMSARRSDAPGGEIKR